MNVFSMKTAALLAVAGLFPLLQESGGKAPDAGLFKAPVRLQAGDRFLGENRLYPSPCVHDLDGDGLPDIVVGDLMGKVTVATRMSTEGVLTHEMEKAVQNREGQPLKFHNW